MKTCEMDESIELVSIVAEPKSSLGVNTTLSLTHYTRMFSTRVTPISVKKNHIHGKENCVPLPQI